MNKKLLILPVISALLLAGCTMGRTTKKKKKSSSVDVTSQSVAPAPTSGTPAPAPTSATPGPTPTSATPAPTPTSQTSQIPTPTSSTSVIPPVTGWSSEELNVFNTNFGGIVPPYVEGGLDLENSELDKGVVYSQDMTETQANAYLTSLDSSWEFNQDAEQGDYYAKDTADGSAYVLIYSGYYEDDTSTFYIVFQYGEYEGGGGGDVPPSGEGAWTQITSKPTVEGGDYVLGCFDTKNNADHFCNGEPTQYYISCNETSVDNAAHFTVELDGNGIKIKMTSGPSAYVGKYLEAYMPDTTHVNVRYSDTGTTFDWVTSEGSYTCNTFGAKFDKGDSYGSQYNILCQREGYSDLRPTTPNYWATNYNGCLYQYVESN